MGDIPSPGKDLTGELTPPGITFCNFSNIFYDIVRSISHSWVHVDKVSSNLYRKKVKTRSEKINGGIKWYTLLIN